MEKEEPTLKELVKDLCEFFSSNDVWVMEDLCFKGCVEKDHKKTDILNNKFAALLLKTNNVPLKYMKPKEVPRETNM